ncbi:MAG: ABC transporter ATP-binding protein [Actinomycetota bacterium]|nr:ABC transporter ATP-binding protein [Actinomycetota bacterium]MDP2287405.1 ABC transporter ATP-binding protein [Actinomycetota bacterium]
MSEIAVGINDVGKRFMRSAERRNSIKERIVRGRARRAEDFWAVRNLSLDIPKGSVYGLIGHNGSGKSTLLKMIGGIYRPTEGSIVSQGRIASLIELGAGFHPEMTGRENIGLNGSILGMPRKEIAAVTDEIIEFSGLREFIDDPVKHYSSGMYVRLGFAVAVHMKPDVLLVDEVLAVGDEEFQRKCFDHLYALRRAGKTIIVVSHGLGQLEALCDEVAWLERGTLQEVGEPTDVVASYLKKVNAEESARSPLATAVRPLDHEGGVKSALRVTSVQVTNTEGVPLNHAETGTTFTLKVGIATSEPVLGPNVRIALQHETGPLVAMISNHRLGFDFSYVDGEHVVEIDLLKNPLLPGRYRVHVDVFDHTGSKLLDSWNDAAEFPVRSATGEIGQGFVQLPAEYRLT